MSFLAALIGLSALLAYDFIWWRVRTKGPTVLRFSIKSPTIHWLEDWIEPIALAAFTVLLGWNVAQVTAESLKCLFLGGCK